MNTKEMIEVMQAFEDGQKIECRTFGTKDTWDSASQPCWNWERYDYRIAPEPKKYGRWERVEIRIDDGDYVIVWPEEEWVHLSRVNAIPGFGGIEYRSPFDKERVVRSMVPVMFDPFGVAITAGFSGYETVCRPGIPVAAWFWREE